MMPSIFIYLNYRCAVCVLLLCTQCAQDLAEFTMFVVYDDHNVVENGGMWTIDVHDYWVVLFHDYSQCAMFRQCRVDCDERATIGDTFVTHMCAE